MVDGGISSNRFVMQFIADLLEIEVVNIGIQDVSALGAGYLAGLKSGAYKDMSALTHLNGNQKVFSPMPGEKIKGYYKSWQQAVSA